MNNDELRMGNLLSARTCVALSKMLIAVHLSIYP